MKFRYWVANLFLFAGVLFLASQNYRAWTGPFDLPPSPGTRPAQSAAPKDPPPGAASGPQTVSARSPDLISEKNIFSPERRDFPAAAAAPEPPKPAGRPRIVLHGVAIAGDSRFATVSHPGRPLQNGERETRTLKIGGKIGEYRLAKILPDRIAMENGQDAFEVLLNDPRAPGGRPEGAPETRPVETQTPGAVPQPPSGRAPEPAGAAAPAPPIPVQARQALSIPPGADTTPPPPSIAERLGRRSYYNPYRPSGRNPAGKGPGEAVTRTE